LLCFTQNAEICGHIPIRYEKLHDGTAWFLIWNTVDGILNVPHTKTAEELGIPVRTVTDKML
jgi:hypothetical protein